ncbi:MAG: MBL fold metallo-hydrolase [Planctomycetes bacterium]|nr:MBL fold metallo-hydrolase [Planctomycetota bacterium]
MELRFFGATGNTTGTCHGIRAGGHTVLLDCGMFQGRRDEARRLNERFGFDAGRIDAVVQSHAHVDHSGKLPVLVRRGFTGRIFATPATRDLCEILLHDSARILLQDAEHLNRQRMRKKLLSQRARAEFRQRAKREKADARRTRRGKHAHESAAANDEHARRDAGRQGRATGASEGVPFGRGVRSDLRGLESGARDDGAPALPTWNRNEPFRLPHESNLPEREVLPLFLEEDVDATMPLFAPRDYGEWFEAAPNMRFRFHDAGHILGSAWVEGEIREGTRLHRLVFTGDYGRKHQPILRDPAELLPADVYISESTYGNRTHPPFERLDEELAAAVRRLAERGRGRLLVPAFAVGRTQNVLYSLARIFREKLAPPVRVVVDSPLGTAATRIVLRHRECFDEEALREYERFQADPTLRAWLSFTDSVDESKALNADPRPTLIVSSSGMMESGRILHHLANGVSREETEILIVGFQAEHTLGRRLLEGATTVNVLGLAYAVRARVTPLLGFSAHADKDELIAALEPHAHRATHLFLVHGEEDQRQPLARELAARGFARVECPTDSRAWRI